MSCPVRSLTKIPNEFWAAQDGKIRPSDKGAPSTFRKNDDAIVGYTHSSACASAPPVLKGLLQLKTKSLIANSQVMVHEDIALKNTEKAKTDMEELRNKVQVRIL